MPPSGCIYHCANRVTYSGHLEEDVHCLPSHLPESGSLNQPHLERTPQCRKDTMRSGQCRKQSNRCPINSFPNSTMKCNTPPPYRGVALHGGVGTSIPQSRLSIFWPVECSWSVHGAFRNTLQGTTAHFPVAEDQSEESRRAGGALNLMINRYPKYLDRIWTAESLEQTGDQGQAIR